MAYTQSGCCATDFAHIATKCNFLKKAFIYGCMNVFSVRLFAQESWQRLRWEKLKLLVCCICVAGGTVLGMVLFNATQCEWWGTNRFDYAFKLMHGGLFALFVSYAFCLVLISLPLSLCFVWQWAWFVPYVVAFGTAIYFGANCCAVVIYDGFLGVLYVVFVLLVELASNAFCCFWAATDCCCCGCFLPLSRQAKEVMAMQIVAVFVKLFVNFVLLRGITALI